MIVNRCKICKGSNLDLVLDLGMQAMTGQFPVPGESVNEGHLDLLKCADCDLVQIGHEYEMGDMYGEGYGYRSSLNPSMVAHLQGKARELSARFPSAPSVLDIGSNDGTLLRAFEVSSDKFGVDPSAESLREFYDDNSKLIVDFFSQDVVRNSFNTKKFDVVTSISMFYDLPDPSGFVANVKEVLSPEGVWHFEQSYMPTMLEMNSYDTVCHEHIEYYSLGVIQELLKINNLKIIDVDLNSINGGSIAITAAHEDSNRPIQNTELLNYLIAKEILLDLGSISPYVDFANRCQLRRDELKALIGSIVASGKTVYGYGASTKGNVILQY